MSFQVCAQLFQCGIGSDVSRQVELSRSAAGAGRALWISTIRRVSISLRLVCDGLLQGVRCVKRCL
jgi:hypothetical protein